MNMKQNEKEQVKGSELPSTTRQGKGRTRHSKGSGKQFKNRGSGLDFQKKENDPAFYFKYAKLAANVGNVPFNHRAGDETQIITPVAGSLNNRLDYILAMHMLLTPGISKDGDSGINLTSKAAWKMLNRRFRGVSKYQQSDFGIIQFGIVDFFASLAEAERIYGVLQHYSLNNKLVPNHVMLAMGCDPESFQNLADFRVELNKIVLSAKTLCLVKGYSLLDHALLMLSNIFKDKDTNRAQLMLFRKPGYWLYDPTNANGSSLVFVKYSTSTVLHNAADTTIGFLRKQKDVIADLKFQLNALLNDDDVDNVCSDILAFYGNKEDPAEIVTLSMIPEDYEVVPVFSDSICRQVHNVMPFGRYDGYTTPGYVGSTPLDKYSTVQPSAWNSTSVCIWQENNAIQFSLRNYTGTMYYEDNGGYRYAYGDSTNFNFGIQTLIDTDILSPSPEEVFEMTRLVSLGETVTATISGGTKRAVNAVTCPSTTIISTLWHVFDTLSPTYTASSGTGYDHIYKIALNIVDSHVANIAGYEYAFIGRFDWSPICYDEDMEVFGDLDNFRPINPGTLKPINEIAIISEFKNPITDLLLKED